MYLPTIEKGGSENVMELSGWTAKLEDLEVSLSKEFYKQYAGLPYDENVMVEHSARLQGLRREEFLSPGASINLDSFSCLDPEPYLGGILS